MSLEQDIKKLDNKRFGAAIKDTECGHEKWTKKCSICGTILETEQQVLVDGPLKSTWPEFEHLLTSYDISQKLKHAGIHGHSVLYWVHVISSGHKCLRSKSNLTLNNTEIFPAFTVQELFVMLDKVDANLEEVTDNRRNPDALAEILYAIYNLE